MDNKNSITITNSQFALLLVTSMIGTGLFSLPNDVLKYAKQDGWMSCIFGSIYPIIMVLIASYLCKKHPNENIYMLSHRCFGKIIGTILNAIFTLYFLVIGSAIADGMINILKIHAVPFLISPKMLPVFLIVPAFISFKGLKTVSRVSEIISYSTAFLFIVPLISLKSGSINNLMPVFGSGALNIIKSSKDTAMAYTGIEIVLLFYPFIHTKEKITKTSIIGVIITAIIYTWFTFITIYYLGVDIIPKFIWSGLTIIHPLAISVINNSKSIFIIFWAAIMFKCISIFYYSIIFSFNQIFNKISIKAYAIILYPLTTILAFKFGPPIIRSYILDKILSKFVIFNLLYALSIALILTVKDKNKHYQN